MLSLSLAGEKGQKSLLGSCPKGGDWVETGPASLHWVQSQSTWDFKQLISPICRTISF